MLFSVDLMEKIKNSMMFVVHISVAASSTVPYIYDKTQTILNFAENRKAWTNNCNNNGCVYILQQHNNHHLFIIPSIFSMRMRNVAK